MRERERNRCGRKIQRESLREKDKKRYRSGSRRGRRQRWERKR